MTENDATVVAELIDSGIEKSVETMKTELTETIKKEIAMNAKPQIFNQKIDVKPPDNQLGGIMKAFGMLRLNQKEEFDVNIKTLDDAFKAMGKEATNYISKDLSAGILASGGALIMPMYSQEIIPALVANTTIRKAGCPTIDMPNGNLTIPGMDTIGGAYWHGETKAKSKGDPTFTQIRMNAKKLGKELAISNDLIKYGMSNTEAQIQNSIVLSLAIEEDNAYINSVGTAFTPKGLVGWQKASQAVATTGTTLAQIKADLVKAKNRLDAANVIELNRVWLMHPSVKNYLMSLESSTVTGLGTSIAQEIITSNTILGYKIFTTTQISGVSGSAPVYLVDLEYCLIGQGRPLELRFTPYGNFNDSAGNVVSGSTTDMSVFTALLEVDFIVKKDLAVSSITGTAWV
jgi:HK97 family phage major capsid protein